MRRYPIPTGAVSPAQATAVSSGSKLGRFLRLCKEFLTENLYVLRSVDAETDDVALDGQHLHCDAEAGKHDLFFDATREDEHGGVPSFDVVSVGRAPALPRQQYR